MKTEDLHAQRFVLDPKSTADLRNRLRDDPQAGLKLAAEQFEGMLLQMMLKSMRDATPQDGPLDNDQTRFFTSIMDQQVAQNLASRGALGFARMIEKQLGQTLPSGTSGELASSLENLKQTVLQSQSQRLMAGDASAMVGTGAERIRSSLSSEGASAGTVPDTSKPLQNNVDFVNRVWPHAVEAARTLGVPPQFLVAHAALESGWGKSEIRLPDGSSSYNLFGVKAGRSWKGASVDVATTEYVDGVAQSAREKFRVYGSYAEAFNDYAALLKNNSRYAGVLGVQDGAQYARSLQQAGYATDPDYADKLSRIINGNTLRQSLLG